MKSDQFRYVSEGELASLSFESRMALGASWYEMVLGPYSRYFQETFLQRDALEMAWRLASGAPVNIRSCRELAKQINDLMERAEAEDYPSDLLLPGQLLLKEAETRDGKSLLQAIDYTANSFASWCYYRQGVNPLDDKIPSDYFYSLSSYVYDLARREFDAISISRSVWGRQRLLHQFSLDRNVPKPVAKGSCRSKRTPTEA